MASGLKYSVKWLVAGKGWWRADLVLGTAYVQIKARWAQHSASWHWTEVRSVEAGEKGFVNFERRPQGRLLEVRFKPAIDAEIQSLIEEGNRRIQAATKREAAASKRHAEADRRAQAERNKQEKARLKTVTQDVLSRLAPSGAGPVEMAEHAISQYVDGPSQLETRRLLCRIAKRHLAADETVLWAGALQVYSTTSSPESMRTKDAWAMLTSKRFFFAPRRTGEPRSYPVESVDLHHYHIFVPGNDISVLASINGGRFMWDPWGQPMTPERAAFEAALEVARRGLPRLPVTQTHPREAVRRPVPRLIRTARDAELVATEWMQWFGFADARPTAIGPDSGIDVVSEKAVAQVKMEGIPSTRPYVQALYGVAAADQKQGVFFSLAGYTNDAITWANRVGLPLFTFDLQGEPEPVNDPARSLSAKTGG